MNRRNFREGTMRCIRCNNRTARVCQSRDRKTGKEGPIQKPYAWKWEGDKLICPDCKEENKKDE